MKKLILIVVLFISMFSTAFTYKNKDIVKDYLGIGGPLNFDTENYNLSWSSHPTKNLYKQEYIPKNEIADKFNSMVMIDLNIGDFTVEDVLKAKVAELKKLKESNPVVNYHVIQNDAKGEYMLDFLVSDNTPDGKAINIVERNIYRYKAYSDKNGKKGVLMFGISKRSYGDDITGFFKKLKSDLNDLVNAVGAYSFPEVTLAAE